LSPASRYLLFTLGLLLAIPLLAVLYLSVGIPVSPTGIVYLIGYFLIVLGLICSQWLHRWALLLSMAGISILFVTVAIRILFPPSGSKMNLMTLPGPSSPRLLTRIFDEQDIVLFGAKVAPAIGFVSSTEYEDLIHDLSQTYREMRVQGVTPLSPALTTYLGQQHLDGFDALVTQPSPGDSETGIVFLHGFGGNFTLQCWLIAKAGNRIGAFTICPSTDPSGQWWKEGGATILQESLTFLKQRGVKRVYLAGISNGAIGASQLADRFKNDLTGLILISGADPDATITGLPVLVISGRDDGRIPASMIEQYSKFSAPNSTLRLFEGDHFLLLKKADQVQETITEWLQEQEGYSPGK
jgi:hypothetical protein